jgi:hypothetical protein
MKKSSGQHGDELLGAMLTHPLISIGVGLVFSILLLLLASSGKTNNFEDLALGKNNVPVYAEYHGTRIHCTGVDDANLCLQGARERHLPNMALWLGNSQLHAINQYKPGQENAPPILFRILTNKCVDLLTFSQPNASFQEQYVLFEYLRNRLSPDVLILPLVFDDTRETGIRDSISTALKQPETITSLKATEIGQRILAEDQKSGSGSKDFAGLAETVQEQVEVAANNWLSGHFQLWASRPEVRGRLFDDLYNFRNTIFRITPQTKRRIIRSRYQDNLDALDAILTTASSANIKVLAYIAPLRMDVDVPYNLEEYDRFKGDTENLVRSKGAAFLNLEALVPGELWGEKPATTVGGEYELDFMHFQAAGHVLLAQALGREVDALILGFPDDL